MPAYRLPMPTSTNDLLRPAFMGDLRCPFCNNKPPRRPLVRFVSTTEAKDFREAAQRRLPLAPVAGAVEVYATFFVDRLSTDVDNRLKALLDALKGRLLYDDKQVAELHVVKVITSDESKHGVVVEVKPASPLEHPELARRLASSTVQQQANAAAQPSLPLPTNETPKQEVRPQPVHIPGESHLQRVVRLARPALITNRKPDDEPPEAA